MDWWLHGLRRLGCLATQGSPLASCDSSGAISWWAGPDEDGRDGGGATPRTSLGGARRSSIG